MELDKIFNKMSYYPNEIYFTQAEVARYLGVHRSTVLKYEKECGLPSYKPKNGRKYYKIEEVKEWMLSNKTQK